MRTTVNLDDDVHQAIASLAECSGLSFSKALSMVARHGLNPRPFKKKKNGLPVFDIPPDAPMIPGMLTYKFIEEEGII